MNTGQMLLVIGALVLLAGVTIVVNNMLATKTQTMLESEAGLNAISLAQSMLDEVMSKSYDARTADGTVIFVASDFTSAGSLGCNATEASNVPQPEPPDTARPYKSLKYYNDVDDYNNYKRYAFTSMGTFTLIDTVFYVQETNPDQMVSVQTFAKKVVVTVTHPNMKYALQLSNVAVYRRYF